MKSFLFCSCVIALVVAGGCATGKRDKTAAPIPVSVSSLPVEPKLNKDDRILVFAPHPDDETIACGGVIQQARAMGLPVRIVWLTNGDNNELSFILYRKHLTFMPSAIRAMGEVRHKEGVAAAKTLGVDEKDLAFLGYPDFETLTIWYRHWGSRPPLESMLTKVTKVPYADGFRPGAPYKGEDILADIEANLRAFQPTKVFVSHPSDHNVDHQSLYLFVRVALWNLQKEMQPDVYPYLVHFAKWPVPLGYKPEASLTPPSELASPVKWGIVPLTPEDVQVKYDAIHRHKSQYDASPAYLASFMRSNELFGDFPPFKMAKTTDRTAPGLDEMTEQERAKFVGIEQVHSRLDAGDLVVTVHFSRPLGDEAEASIFAFGYRQDKPFVQMPKLRVNFGNVGHVVLDQTTRLPGHTVQFQSKAHELTARIPLKAMGDPERVLTCVHTYLGQDPLDWAEWRILELPR
jgi:LmbE family N-acetylglucosaminyl deacetylase